MSCLTDFKMELFSKVNFLLHQKTKIPYYYYRAIGLFDKFKPLNHCFAESENVVIVSKGASLAEIPATKLEQAIDSADIKVLVSSVDIENHPVLSQKSYDIQVVSRIDNIDGYVPVYNKKTLNSYGINALCVNTSRNYMSGLSIYKFYKYFSRLGLQMYHTEGGVSYVSDDASEYGGKGLTIIQSIISHALSSEKVKSITFLGVDFYGTGYLDSMRAKKPNELNLFPKIETLSTDPRNNRGIPLIKYLIALANCPKMNVKINFPCEILKYIPDENQSDFVNSTCINII